MSASRSSMWAQPFSSSWLLRPSHLLRVWQLEAFCRLHLPVFRKA